MYKQLTYLKDSLNQSYVGVKFTKDEIIECLNVWETIFLSNPNSDIDDFTLLSKNRLDRDGESYHITLLSVMEYNRIKDSLNVDDLIDDMIHLYVNDIIFEGIGKVEKNDNEAFFIIINSEILNSVRLKFGFDKKDLHITVGFNKKDIHGVDKSINTLIVRI